MYHSEPFPVAKSTMLPLRNTAGEVKRVQVLMSPCCHRVLKQICAIDGISMSDFMYKCARAQIHQRAKTDDHILTLLQREGIELDP